MSFSDFHGNADVVRSLREILARDRFPHAVILAGPQGAGKYTLALMLARTMNCTEIGRETDGLPDFCGHCDNCRRIGESLDLEARFGEAVEAREAMRETDKRETRIFVQTHPDVLVIPPDPPQMMIKVDQVRHVIANIYKRPRMGKHSIFIFTTSAMMKEAANSLLKVLEEPPEYATLFLLTTNPGEFLPTIRSRCITLQLAPLQTQEIELLLAKRRFDWPAPTRSLVARLAGGAVGKALSFDLEAYTAARKDAMVLLNSALNAEDHSNLFRTTEGYRAGAEGKAKTDQLLRATYTLLEDMLYVKSGTPELVRNSDIRTEIMKMAAATDFEWIATASQRLGELESGMRRNILRSLSLDAFAVGMEHQRA